MNNPAPARPAKPAKKLLPSPAEPLTGKYKKVEPLSTQMQFDASGKAFGSSDAELQAIRDRRRAKGLPDDELSCRIELVDARIRRAYHTRAARNAADPAGRGDVLSVFTAPEWTFKMPETPLTPKQREQVVEHYRKLSAQYPGMLIVPGTIVTNTGSKKAPRIEAEAIAVYQGSVVKRTRKANEGFDTTGYKKADGTKVRIEDFNGLTKATDGPSMYQGDSTIFELEGLTFSLEICADHGSSRARTDAERSGGKGVDVQILVSDGAALRADGLAAHEGGVVITNDAKPFADHNETVPGGIREVGRPGNYTQGEGRPDTHEDIGELQAPAPLEIRR